MGLRSPARKRKGWLERPNVRFCCALTASEGHRTFVSDGDPWARVGLRGLLVGRLIQICFPDFNSNVVVIVGVVGADRIAVALVGDSETPRQAVNVWMGCSRAWRV